MSSQTAFPPCPVCLSSHGVTVDQLEKSALVEGWGCLGVQLTPQALEVLDKLDSIPRFACNHCGMQYFDPALAGSERFYAELQQQLPNYYPVTCPAFDRAVRFARAKSLSSVLDVGCGTGAFLDLARNAGLQTSGLEYNSRAAETAANKGHRLRSCSMAEYRAQHDIEQFDLVTAFEVLEHVSAPRSFVADAAQLVRPGGYCAVAVPSAEGVHGIWDLDPHQWPPHHLTRWRRQDLARIGRECGLVPQRVGGDLFVGTQWRYFAQLQNRLLSAVKSTTRVSRPGFAPAFTPFIANRPPPWKGGPVVLTAAQGERSGGGPVQPGGASEL